MTKINEILKFTDLNALIKKYSVSIDNTGFNSKFISVDCSKFIEKKLTDDTFAQILRKSRLKLGLSISDVANVCNVTKPVVSGYEYNRYNPTKEVLNLLSSTFNMDYLCMDGYTKLIYTFDEFLDKLDLWINKNNLTKEDATTTLGVSRSLFNYWFNGGVVSMSTYNNIKYNLHKYKLF